MSITFSKYQGAGNDFILIDNRHSLYSPFDVNQIRYLCDRQMGIGADGILWIEMSEIADYKMRIFNADGSEPSMCGNGMRCVCDFLAKGNGFQKLNIEIAGRIVSCCKEGDKIHVNLGTPSLSHWPIELVLRRGPVPVYVLDTGVPHAVLFVQDILGLPFTDLGEEIRWHRAFAPGGVNVNCATVAPDGSMQVRSYERGVENETLACGTGAAATAWVAAHVHGLKEPIVIKTRAELGSDVFQETMQFAFPIHSNGEKQIEMLGTAHCVFTGLIDL